MPSTSNWRSNSENSVFSIIPAYNHDTSNIITQIFNPTIGAKQVNVLSSCRCCNFRFAKTEASDLKQHKNTLFMVSDISQSIDLKKERDSDDDRQIPHLPSSILEISCDSEKEKYMFCEDAARVSSRFDSRQSKKRRVPSACIPCKLSRAKCSDTRPCARCLHNNKCEGCVDGPHFSKVRTSLLRQILIFRHQSTTNRLAKCSTQL